MGIALTKKSFVLFTLLLSLLLTGNFSTKAYGTSLIDESDEVFEEYNINNITDFVNEDEELQGLDIEKVISLMISGDFKSSLGIIWDFIWDMLFKSILDNGGILKKVIIIVLLAAIFTNFTNVLKNGQVASAGFYICYMITVSLILTSYGLIEKMAENTLCRMLDFMKALIPVYVVSVGVSDGNTSAASYYQMAIIIMYLINIICKKILLPLINIYIVVSVIGNMYEADYMSKLAETLEKICSFSIKAMLVVVTGLNVIRKMFEPITGTYKDATKNVMEVLSGLNGTGINIAELVYGTGNIVKNTIGGIGVTIVFVIIIIPVIKLITFILMYQLTNAIIQPISDKRLVSLFEGLTKGLILMLRMLVSTSLMLIITITIICISGRG